MALKRVDYVHRGDRERRRKRISRYVLFSALVASVYALTQLRQEEASAYAPDRDVVSADPERLRSSLDSAVGELNIARAQLERANRVIHFSTTYGVKADLARDIVDIALAEGIEPDLAFRLVQIESAFKEQATSPVGAIGLTQVMLPTAQYFERGITRQRLYERRTNLRIGFRYLRALIGEYKDVKLALLVYNRGPVAVNSLRQMGLDPGNGYDRLVMKGYRGKGTVD
jgi:soluble lytic murein transglycosylase-like protein